MTVETPPAPAAVREARRTAKSPDSGVLGRRPAVHAARVALDPRPLLGRPAIPKEHGVWGFVLAPWLVGVTADRTPPDMRSGLLLLGATSAMMATTAFLDDRRSKGKKVRLRNWAGVYAAAAAGFLIPAVLARPGLLVLALPLGLVGAVSAALVAHRADRTFLGRLVPILGFTALVPAGFHLETGDLPNARVWLLTAAVAAFLAGSLSFVRACFRGRGSRGVRIGCVAYHLGLVAGAGWLAPPLALAFLPGAARLLILLRPRPSAPLVGVTEILTLSAFVGLLIRLGR